MIHIEYRLCNFISLLTAAGHSSWGYPLNAVRRQIGFKNAEDEFRPIHLYDYNCVSYIIVLLVVHVTYNMTSTELSLHHGCNMCSQTTVIMTFYSNVSMLILRVPLPKYCTATVLTGHYDQLEVA